VLTATNAAAMLAEILGRDRVEAEPYALARIVSICGQLPLALSTAAEHAVDEPRLTLAHLADSLASR
jgi:hypothetical protein